MEKAQSNASSTDMSEKFEDATDTNQDSGRTPPETNREKLKTEQNNGTKSTTPNTTNGSIVNGTQDADHQAGESTTVGANGQEDTRTSSPERRASKASVDMEGKPKIDEDLPTRSRKSTVTSLDQTPTASAAGSMKPPPKPSRFPGFSASLPSVPWAAPPKRIPERDPSPQAPQPAPAGRKTPFAWFNRTTSISKEIKSPPLVAKNAMDTRRNTTASISTLGSNPDLMLRALDETSDVASRAPAKPSLREKFKMLRMREEAGITTIDENDTSEGGAIAGLVGRSTSVVIGVGSSQSVEEDEKLSTKNFPTPSALPEPPLTPTNPNLPQGTVSGVSASPLDVATAIDWDFWQNVVNEGPQVVARTSPEEFTIAISGGIPQTIRGVIWQVLAGSKNEDLESVYHELSGAGKTKERRDSVTQAPSITTPKATNEKESVSSTRSSVQSETSTPATAAKNDAASPTSSQETTDAINSAKIQTQLSIERAKKAKEDSAAVSKLEKIIKRDMGSRTSYSKYTAAAGLQDALFNVCKAYALFDEPVGYPQGMNFIIMPLLFTMREEEAFCLLVRLMNKYQVRELFINDMPGLHLHLYQFERLLEDLEPALYCHLNRRNVSPRLYATQWFLTLFAYRFPLQLVMRVFDLVLCEGLEAAILKFGMAVIQRNVPALLAMNDMQALTTFLKEKIFDVYIDSTPSSKSLLESGFFGNSGGSESEVYRADLLVQDACAIKLTPDMLNRYREEWEEKTKTEKARETEVENLRTDTATKATQIRSLEKRAEKSDAEHIEIANELVKVKVENQELIDINESLKGQVEELKKVADSEATKVEERLRAGTEQVMQRNIEVQNENRNMEEQMAEMEKELVEMKMKYAELNAEHESLKQKWHDLRKALD